MYKVPARRGGGGWEGVGAVQGNRFHFPAFLQGECNGSIKIHCLHT